MNVKMLVYSRFNHAEQVTRIQQEFMYLHMNIFITQITEYWVIEMFKTDYLLTATAVFQTHSFITQLLSHRFVLSRSETLIVRMSFARCFKLFVGQAISVYAANPLIPCIFHIPSLSSLMLWESSWKNTPFRMQHIPFPNWSLWFLFRPTVRNLSQRRLEKSGDSTVAERGNLLLFWMLLLSIHQSPPRTDDYIRARHCNSTQNRCTRRVVCLCIHSFHAWSIPPVATACFVPVVTIVTSVIGTSASLAVSWQSSYFWV